VTSNDSDVIVVVHWTFTVNATGRSASMYMQHWWRLADGKIVFFRGSEDTEQSAAAFA
jgi:ketosteroid isomerase-like protein